MKALTVDGNTQERREDEAEYTLMSSPMKSRWKKGMLSAEDQVATNGDDDLEPYRFVYLNNPIENAKLRYIGNTIITSRYTMFSFLPKVLLYQFSKLANAYFLIISIMQCIKRISTTDGFPASLPALSIIVLIDMIFIAMEDFRRHKSDNLTNDIPVHRFDSEKMVFEQRPSRSLVVGDMIKVRHQPSGICYVETKSLDGETNLKLRQGVECVYTKIRSDADLARLQGHVVRNISLAKTSPLNRLSL
ncbi:hypothetical protein DYB32_001284 [Aphanomyces invadans]|uniref:P-type ATPase N-terminal domain-containing protein n=1 Tax=Aphanomyces invadans TaxID=157072 RepID=A0A3R7D6D8_9STRA|nr:hypothetical protein DYB32_001284 [Aphanomyces invadans]